MHKKQNHVYVGLDLHKETHTAVIIDCWNEKLGELTFENRPSAFEGLLDKAKKCSQGLTPVFGLEDVGGYGRSLALYLLEKGYAVKSVNPSLSWAQRMSAPTTKKDDSYDAFCIACILLNKLNDLPDANPQDLYWTMAQLVGRRESLVKTQIIIKNQLHVNLVHNYPKYTKFFALIDGKAALTFWEQYPSPIHLKDITTEELTTVLQKASRNSCSTRKAEEILTLVKDDGSTHREYQESRDMIIRNIIKQIRFIKEQIREVEVEMEKIMALTGYKLNTLAGINTVTACSLIAEIGDIGRFRNADKLARFSGIAPVNLSSAGKGKDQKCRQGNRKLHGIFYFLAVQQVQTSKCSGLPRNPVFREYYQKKIREGKTKTKALFCVMRRLVNIIYGMMKNKTEYVMPSLPEKDAV